jgi:hypothetical protein
MADSQKNQLKNKFSDVFECFLSQIDLNIVFFLLIHLEYKTIEKYFLKN